jgi:hypothetical protein
MPDLDCLTDKIADLEKGQLMQAQQMMQLSADMVRNTEMTTKVQENTEEIIELMKWLDTSKKIVLWLGGLIGGIWAIVETLRHFRL